LSAHRAMGHSVLIADDEADQLELLKFTLENEGFRVFTALDGLEAIEKAVTLAPDVILLDVMLPDVDGFSICEHLRKNNVTALTPVLFLTCLASESARAIGVEVGGNDYMSKPFSPREVVSRIRSLAEKHAARN
jgi:two-component system alkaline phosphatase synthesis response regulator PhoP